MDPRDENLPAHAPVELEAPFVDDRGKIQNILHHMIGSSVIIHSVAGAIRANHYHKTDYHYCYVVSGQIEYLERPHGDNAPPTRYLFSEGDLFFTPPMVEHTMRFPVDTVFLTLARNSRYHDTYEDDLVRIADLFDELPSETTEAPAQPTGRCAHRDTCRLCNATDLELVMELTPTPPANAFVATRIEQATYPLRLYLCSACGHLQLLDVVDPTELFENYVYASGTSPAFVDHFRRYAGAVLDDADLKSDDLVVEIGSNDGTMLRFFKDAGMKVLGVDPATDIAKAATENGIETLNEFFTAETAESIKNAHGGAQVVIANNVFAHADDLHEIAAGVRTLLSDDGSFWFEVQHLLPMVRDGLFDMVYHEHLSYHTVTPLIPFLASVGLDLVAVDLVPTHGGSIRCKAVPAIEGVNRGSVESSVAEVVALEREAGLFDPVTFEAFSARIDEAGRILSAVLAAIRASGKRVAGYGAPAKATTLMYQFGLGPATLDYIVDDSPLKQGLLTPGRHVPVVTSDAMYADPPDYLLILAWNFAEPIIEKHARFGAEGGHFIVPLPNLRIT